MDAYERALYGAISGDVTSVLPVCSSWEDNVWAHVNALLEESVEAGLWSSSEGRFWSRNTVHAIQSSALPVEDASLGTTPKSGAELRQELASIFDRILKTERGDLGNSAKNPFRVSQTYLIVGNVAELFTTFVDRLEASAVDTEPE